MEEFSVLICDFDSAYVNALSTYLGSRKRRISVSAYTQIDSFLNGQGHYNLALLEKSFLESYESHQPDIKIDRVLYLSENVNDGVTSKEIFYKFQNVSNLNDVIAKARYDGCQENKTILGLEVLGIYSPIGHDLRLPFALTLSHIMSQQKKVMFLDLETFSILPDLIRNEDAKKDLLDIMYLMESEGESFQLQEHIFYFEDIAMLPPLKNPENLYFVKEELWERLYKTIMEMGYSIVLLYDGVFPFVHILYEYMDELILLGKSKDYYQYCFNHCKDYILQLDMAPRIHEVMLNMSAENLNEGAYRLKNLMEGNLRSFVWDEFKGTLAISNS
ncbi:MAG: hypothetical protein K6F30_05675 [Lachnospiraceae bacterium]|nr:hypothetical protein [Lachnospiraceae bacterium]